jgi:sRNA-binding protein
VSHLITCLCCVLQATYATRELTEWDARIAAKRRDLLALLRENTAALTTVTDLTHSHRELEARVMAGRHELWQDPLSSRRAAMAERDSLVSRISSQANHLESLRLQLAAMRRKDSAIHG